MKTLLSIITLSVFCAGAFAQQHVTIHGKTKLLSNCRKVKISGLPDALIKPDGSFEVSGNIKEPGIALIMTDSSGASSIWLESGVYTLECKEIKMKDIQSVLMRTSKLIGPLDAMIYNDYGNAAYRGFGTYDPEDEKIPEPRIITEEQKVAIREKQKALAFHYVDSIIKKYPESKVLPNIIRTSKYYTGDEGTKALIAKLSSAQQATEEIQRLLKGLQRNSIIAKEGGFEKFSMKTADGKDFRLSDVKNKN